MTPGCCQILSWGLCTTWWVQTRSHSLCSNTDLIPVWSVHTKRREEENRLVGCQWNEWGCHQATFLSGSFLYWLSTHTYSVLAELRLCSGSFVCIKCMSCSLSYAVNSTIRQICQLNVLFKELFPVTHLFFSGRWQAKIKMRVKHVIPKQEYHTSLNLVFTPNITAQIAWVIHSWFFKRR